jgi:putative intracellular protease/amidase
MIDRGDCWDARTDQFHGPSGLVNATYKDGTPIVKGKTVTSFTDEEEREVELDEYMPFLLESTLRLHGASFVRGEKWTDFSMRDGNLITGRNPQSSRSTAEKVVASLGRTNIRKRLTESITNMG